MLGDFRVIFLAAESAPSVARFWSDEIVGTVRDPSGEIQMLGMASAQYGSSYDSGTWMEITKVKFVD